MTRLPRFATGLVALATLTACASTMPDLQPTPTAPQTPVFSPEAKFSTCVPVTIEAEILDYTVPPEDAETTVQTTQLIAEYPTTPAEMQRGLQGRSPLHPDTAMVFPFDGDHNPVLWMKDTPASLDMVFADPDGEVFHLESGTTPNSETFLTPDEPEPIATHVLELPAGRANNLGIFPGSSRMRVGTPAPCAQWMALS